MKRDDMTETEGSSESSFFETGNTSSRSNNGTDVRDMDVICGRGKMAFHHAGNVRFRDAVARNIDAYNAAEKRLGKPLVVESIIDEVHRSGGRFLKRDTFRDRWVELTPQQKRDKVSHAIRDATKLGELAAAKKKDTQPKPKVTTDLDPVLHKSAPIEFDQSFQSITDVAAHHQSLSHIGSHSRSSSGSSRSNAAGTSSKDQGSFWHSARPQPIEWDTHIEQQHVKQHKEQHVMEMKAKLDLALQAATSVGDGTLPHDPFWHDDKNNLCRKQHLELHEEYDSKPPALGNRFRQVCPSTSVHMEAPDVPSSSESVKMDHPLSPKLADQTQHDSLSNFSCGSLDLGTSMNEGETPPNAQLMNPPLNVVQKQHHQQLQQQQPTPQVQRIQHHQKARRTSSITMTDLSNKSALSAMEWSMASLDISAVGDQWWTPHTAGLTAIEGLAHLSEMDSCRSLDLNLLDDEDNGIPEQHNRNEEEVFVPQQFVSVCHEGGTSMHSEDISPSREVIVPRRVNVAPPPSRAGSKSLELLAATVTDSVSPRRRRRQDSDEYQDDQSSVAVDTSINYHSSTTDESVAGSNRSSVSVGT